MNLIKKSIFLSATALTLAGTALADEKSVQELCVLAKPNYSGGNTAFEIRQDENANNFTKLSYGTSHSYDHDGTKTTVAATFNFAENGEGILKINDESEFIETEVITINNDNKIGLTGQRFSTGEILVKFKNGFESSKELLCVQGTLQEFYTAHPDAAVGLYYVPNAILGNP